jgi:hypothetical protein
VLALEDRERGHEHPFDGPVLAALIASASLGGPVWLVADPAAALERTPSFGGAPWFLFAELPALRRWPAAHVLSTFLDALAGVRRQPVVGDFPFGLHATARVPGGVVASPLIRHASTRPGRTCQTEPAERRLRTRPPFSAASSLP